MATYQTVDWNDKYRKNIGTAAYDKQYADYAAGAEASRQQQLGEAQKTQQAALKQAYITRLQNQQKLNDNLAMAGIRGGATETSNLRLANQYGSERGLANSTYANSVNSINQAVDQNLRDAKMDIESQREQYIQNQANARWQAAREDAANKYNAATDAEKFKYQKQQDALAIKREDAANKYERQQAEIARQTQYWSDYYNNVYSGSSKKTVQKAIQDINKRLNSKSLTQYEKIRLQQQKAAASARLGVIANK